MNEYPTTYVVENLTFEIIKELLIKQYGTTVKIRKGTQASKRSQIIVCSRQPIGSNVLREVCNFVLGCSSTLEFLKEYDVE